MSVPLIVPFIVPLNGAIQLDVHALMAALKQELLQTDTSLRTKPAEYELEKKGRRVTMHKIILILIMGVILAGAATSIPGPVLLVMGCWILFALSIAMRSERQG